MEIFILIAIALLSSLVVFNAIALQKLKKKSASASALLNDLTFKHNNSTEILTNRIAGIHYEILENSGNIIFYPQTLMEEALSHLGAREILIKRKMIRNKDKGPFEGSLAERAKIRKLSLEPILIALNNLENKS